jgi:hypothetical protein
VCNSVSRVDDSSSKGPFGDHFGCPRGSQGQHSLNGNIKTRDVEGLEHNFGSKLTILWRIERRLSLGGKKKNKTFHTNKK